MLSKSCLYAIRASIYIATLETENFVSITQISEQLGIPFHFLTKILQTLTQKNLMNSYRGPKGGVALARNPNSISLMEIIKAVDGDGLFNECILGLNGCGRQTPCPIHEQWALLRWELQMMFEGMTLMQLSEKIKNSQFRLADATLEQLFPTMMGMQGIHA